MRIWIPVMITLIVLCTAAYWTLYQSFRIPPAIAANGSNRSIAYSSACDLLPTNMSSDFLFLTVRTIPQTRFSRLEASLQTWIEDALEVKNGDGQKLISKIRIVSDSRLPQDKRKNSSWFLESYWRKRHTVHFAFSSHCCKILILFAAASRMIFATGCDRLPFLLSQACKIQKEFQLYYSNAKQSRWFCHFDDDIYINVRSLLVLLSQYNFDDPFYIGKRSLDGIWAWDHENNKKLVVDFATGSALCFSRKTMKMLRPLIVEPHHPWNLMDLVRNGADDITIGYIFQQHFRVPLTEPPLMLCQFDDLRNLTELDIRNAITIGHWGRNTFILPGEDAEDVSQQSSLQRFHVLHAYYKEKEKACHGLPGSLKKVQLKTRCYRRFYMKCEDQH